MSAEVVRIVQFFATRITDFGETRNLFLYLAPFFSTILQSFERNSFLRFCTFTCHILNYPASLVMKLQIHVAPRKLQVASFMRNASYSGSFFWQESYASKASCAARAQYATREDYLCARATRHHGANNRIRPLLGSIRAETPVRHGILRKHT